MPYADGTCRDCGRDPQLGRSRCARCLRARRGHQAQVIAERLGPEELEALVVAAVAEARAISARAAASDS